MDKLKEFLHLVVDKLGNLMHSEAAVNETHSLIEEAVEQVEKYIDNKLSAGVKTVDDVNRQPSTPVENPVSDAAPTTEKSE